MICCRNALGVREPSSLDFHHFFFVASEKDEEVLVGRGGPCGCEMSLGVCGTPSRIGGDVCSVWVTASIGSKNNSSFLSYTILISQNITGYLPCLVAVLMSFPRATAQDLSITPHPPSTLAPAALPPPARATSFAPSPVPSSLLLSSSPAPLSAAPA
jgi:hypothetical protein